jgi:hypothetical protein
MPGPASLRILVVISAPVWDEEGNEEPVHIDTGKEWRNITDGLKQSNVPARIDRLPVATSEKISDALAFAKGDGAPYSIVHIPVTGWRGTWCLMTGSGAPVVLMHEPLARPSITREWVLSS